MAHVNMRPLEPSTTHQQTSTGFELQVGALQHRERALGGEVTFEHALNLKHAAIRWVSVGQG